MSQSNIEDKKKKAAKVKLYAKYSGMVYQLMGLLFVSIYFGLKADKYFEFQTNYLTALFTILVFFAFMYKISITVMRDK